MVLFGVHYSIKIFKGCLDVFPNVHTHFFAHKHLMSGHVNKESSDIGVTHCHAFSLPMQGAASLKLMSSKDGSDVWGHNSNETGW